MTVILFYIISALAVSSTNLISMYIDSIQPKLIWDDENNALRENFNTFIAMSIALLIFGIICGTAYFYLFKNLEMVFFEIILIMSKILIIINLLFVAITMKSGYRNIIEQEET